MEWYRMVWQKYAQFDGRSRRKEYWMFALVNLIIGVALSFCFLAARGSILAIAFGIVCFLYGLAALIPSLAVSVRRLHDIGRSGWWLLIDFIPFGCFVLLIFFVLDGTPGPNEYGPDPKAAVPYSGQPIPIG
ncbi:MAG TPA: DUF805 domain-containing protein [Acidobacteriaceae bacterium]|jgi:uncharacterized membrane protein YhaH (DUF805 family)|nr:DUF805 domain-containing protein [Acidobacteriaceae bacterium]